ncbi:MAG TPA: HigA family addiction module antitoxin [Polyangiaceae bacterium]|nr:HigA family addiction module antitoxin [Polyangiaceae bacterium]
MKPKNGMRPIHPGEILEEEFLKPLGLSSRKLADSLDVPPNRVSSIIAGERVVTADTALRLGRALGTTPQFWLNLQQTYDLRIAEETTDLRGVKRATRRQALGRRHG